LSALLTKKDIEKSWEVVIAGTGSDSSTCGKAQWHGK